MPCPALHPHQGRQELVVVLPVFRRRQIAAEECHLCRQRGVVPDSLLQPFHSHKTSLVVVQTQADLIYRRVVPEKLQECIGRGAAQGEVVASLPRAAVALLQRRQGEGVDGALGHSQPGTGRVRCRQAEGIPLVAACCIQLEAVPRPPQGGGPGTASQVPPHKNTVLIPSALIEDAELQAEADDLRVNAPVLQIGHHGGGAPAGRWKPEGCGRPGDRALWLWRRAVPT